MRIKPMNVSLTLFFLAAAFSGSLARGAAPSPEEVIKQVDEIRNPAESFQMKVEVTNAGDSNAASVFEVSLQGNAKTLIKTLEPARDRGRNLLMLAEEMWAYIPNLRRAVRVGLSQKLTGQAANGDISRMRWSGDYTPVLESSKGGTWQILLTAKKKGLTYEKVRAWIDQKNFHPLKAEFLTPAGKVLKRAQYQGYKQLAGKVRPSEILIQDAVKEKEKSTLRIVSMEVKRFPDSIFNQNSLK